MKLVPIHDDPRPKTLKVTGRTRTSLQTDGRTTPDGRIKSHGLQLNVNAFARTIEKKVLYGDVIFKEDLVTKEKVYNKH